MMCTRILPFGAAIAIALAASEPLLAQVREYRVEASHSDVEFTIGFLGGKVHGRFEGIRGTLLYDDLDPSRSSIAVAIDLTSLNTGSRHRDEHLQSSDFFDVGRYPMALFRSTAISRTADGFAARGTLQLHGVAREIVIPFAPLHSPMADPHGATLLDFAAHVRLARSDFGIMGGSAHNEWFDQLRSATMADSVEIALQVSAWDTDFARTTDKGLVAAVQRVTQEGTPATVKRARAIATATPDKIKDQEWNVDQIAHALMQRHKTGDAVAIYALAAELYPSSSSARAALGAAYDAAGQTTLADTEYRRALELNPYETRALVRRPP